MEKKEIQKILLKHCVVLDREKYITGMTTKMTSKCAEEIFDKINQK